MTDRNVQWPNRYQLVKVPGTDDIYDLIPAPGTITAEGTMINKASLLTDETAQAYGFTAEQLEGVVPDDVLAAISDILTQSLVMETGNWVGTYSGTSGIRTITIQFDRVPEIVFIVSTEGMSMVARTGNGAEYHGFGVPYQKTGSHFYSISFNEETLQLSMNLFFQLGDAQGVTYSYVSLSRKGE